MKVKGMAKIPDCIQIRDDSFTLISYFNINKIKKGLEKLNLQKYENYILETVKDLPFGKIEKLNIK